MDGLKYIVLSLLCCVSVTDQTRAVEPVSLPAIVQTGMSRLPIALPCIASATGHNGQASSSAASTQSDNLLKVTITKPPNTNSFTLCKEGY